ISVPASIYEFNPLTPEQRAAVLSAYRRQEDITATLRLCEAFSSPYELSVAAEVLGEISGRPHRTSLFDAFIRQRCEQISAPSLARPLLVAVAQCMSAKLKSSLSHFEIWQVAEPFCKRRSGQPQLLSELIDCGLLYDNRGRCSFRHELLE